MNQERQPVSDRLRFHAESLNTTIPELIKKNPRKTNKHLRRALVALKSEGFTNAEMGYATERASNTVSTLVKRELRSGSRENEARPNPQEILEKHAVEGGVTVSKMLQRSPRKVNRPLRQAMVELRQHYLISEVATITNRNLSTTWYLIDREERLQKTEPGELKEAKITSAEEIHNLAVTLLNENFPGISMQDVQSESRRFLVRLPRQAVARILHNHFKVPVVKIGAEMSRDPSTISHAIHIPEEKFQKEISLWKEQYEAQSRREEKKEVRQRKVEIRRLEKIQKERKEYAYIQAVLEVVADHYSVGIDEIISQTLKKRFIHPRQTAMYLIVNGTERYLQNIALIMGLKSGSSVRRAYDLLETEMEHDDELRDRVNIMQVEANKLVESKKLVRNLSSQSEA